MSTGYRLDVTVCLPDGSQSRGYIEVRLYRDFVAIAACHLNDTEVAWLHEDYAPPRTVWPWQKPKTLEMRVRAGIERMAEKLRKDLYKSPICPSFLDEIGRAVASFAPPKEDPKEATP